MDEMVEKLLNGAALGCVMRPDDEIPTNRPLHDECFNFPHIIIDGDWFSAISGRDIVTKPGAELPIVFYYTNYKEMFGTFAPVQVEPGFSDHALLRTSFSPRKRYKAFEWIIKQNSTKIWDSHSPKDLEAIRAAVLRAAHLKVAFQDEENIWNIHPVVLPQVACREDTFLLQTAYIAYPQFFRKVEEFVGAVESHEENRAYFTSDKLCYTQPKGIKASPFHGFYHLSNDRTYQSYYDLSRESTLHRYNRLLVFAEE